MFNGVKQDEVIDPVLFCISLAILLRKLADAGFGRYIGENFVGALAYADDIVLLTNTAGALLSILDICDDFSENIP